MDQDKTKTATDELDATSEARILTMYEGHSKLRHRSVAFYTFLTILILSAIPFIYILSNDTASTPASGLPTLLAILFIGPFIAVGIIGTIVSVLFSAIGKRPSVPKDADGNFVHVTAVDVRNRHFVISLIFSLILLTAALIGLLLEVFGGSQINYPALPWIFYIVLYIGYAIGGIGMLIGVISNISVANGKFSLYSKMQNILLAIILIVATCCIAGSHYLYSYNAEQYDLGASNMQYENERLHQAEMEEEQLKLQYEQQATWISQAEALKLIAKCEVSVLEMYGDNMYADIYLYDPVTTLGPDVAEYYSGSIGVNEMIGSTLSDAMQKLIADNSCSRSDPVPALKQEL